MRFSWKRRTDFSPAWNIAMVALGWLFLISFLHYQVNSETQKRTVVNLGYMPVITNLAAPVLDFVTREGDGIRFKAIKFSSFAEMAEALRNGQIQAAFMIAPLSIVLRQQGEDVKVILIGNRHESTLVARKELNVTHLAGLAGKTVAVPMRYSGHNLALLRQIQDLGLEGQINIVEMNPPDMAAALASGSLDAYYVGEPFAAMTLQKKESGLVQYVEQYWPGFICNLVVVRQSYIERHEQSVETLVRYAARAGLWAGKHPKEAAHIAAMYWKQPLDLVEYALQTPEKRIVYDRFVPKKDEMQTLADLMVRFGLISQSDISGLVEDRFALRADLEGITDLKSVSHGK